jgi:hypothetical protein
MRNGTRGYADRLVRYDPELRRVWIGGQRLHHGLTGAFLAGLGLSGLAARRLTARGCVEAALLGVVLMAHDWRDRSCWFERGAQIRREQTRPQVHRPV